VASRALRRSAAAMLRQLCRRRMAMARLRRLAMARGVATRYDKRAVNYRAMVVIASLMIWLDG
jgi:transposase